MNQEKSQETEIFGLDSVKIFISKEHRFGTDALILAKFAEPKRNWMVCDLCTGCGIIPLVFCSKGLVNRKIYAVDISANAIELLSQSIRENNLGNYIFPVHADLKTFTKTSDSRGYRESFDLVTANPPYFKNLSGGQKSGDIAAARHELLCCIDDIAEAAARLLKFGGLLKLCHKPERLADVFFALRKNNIEPKNLIFISGDNSAEPWLFLLSGKKGAKPGLIIRNAKTRDFV